MADLQDLTERFDELLKMDGFDSCVAGVVIRFNQEPILCYDYEKGIQQLERDMTRDDAEEYFNFNQIGAWVGDRTPCFLVTKG